MNSLAFTSYSISYCLPKAVISSRMAMARGFAEDTSCGAELVDLVLYRAVTSQGRRRPTKSSSPVKLQIYVLCMPNLRKFLFSPCVKLPYFLPKRAHHGIQPAPVSKYYLLVNRCSLILAASSKVR